VLPGNRVICLYFTEVKTRAGAVGYPTETVPLAVHLRVRIGSFHHFHSGLHESTADGVAHQTGGLVDIQLLHESHAV
jgi:hypothetical protein